MNTAILPEELLKPHFGLHLTFDATGCPLEKLNNPELIKSVFTSLVNALEMKELSLPTVLKAPANDKKDPGGYSGFVVIAESHISIHTFDRRGFVSVDVYSCKDFDLYKAIDILKTTFQPNQVETHVVIRGKNYPLANIY